MQSGGGVSLYLFHFEKQDLVLIINPAYGSCCMDLKNIHALNV